VNLTLRAALIHALMLAAMLGGAYWLGVHNTHLAEKVAEVKPLRQAIEVHNEKAVAGQQAETKAVAVQATTRANFARLETEVQVHEETHPTAADCSLDADGLRIWRDANADSQTAPASEPAGPVPGDATAAGKPAPSGPAAQPRPVGGDLPPVPGESQRPGGVAGGHQ
jgi:hypothetical protein